MLSRTKVYGRLKNLFPVSPATANPRFSMGEFVQSTKVTL
jgi:hypothetical protein